MFVADPNQRISMAGIKRHPFFVAGLPEGALAMNDHLLNIRPFSDPTVHHLIEVILVQSSVFAIVLNTSEETSFIVLCICQTVDSHFQIWHTIPSTMLSNGLQCNPQGGRKALCVRLAMLLLEGGLETHFVLLQCGVLEAEIDNCAAVAAV